MHACMHVCLYGEECPLCVFIQEHTEWAVMLLYATTCKLRYMDVFIKLEVYIDLLRIAVRVGIVKSIYIHV